MLISSKVTNKKYTNDFNFIKDPFTSNMGHLYQLVGQHGRFRLDRLC